MASELHVDAIKHSGGTSALTIDSSGNVNIPGHVIQTQSSVITATTAHTTTTYTDSISATITPKLSSSKIMVWATTSLVGEITSTTYLWFASRLVRVVGGTTTVIFNDHTASNSLMHGWGERSSSGNLQSGTYDTLQFLDSPSTTSAITYKIQTAGRSSVAISVNARSTSSTITMMEIAQ